MKQRDPIDRSPEFERAMRAAEAVASAGGEQYVLKLYITGNTPRSNRAIRNLRAICDRHLRGHCDLEVIDIVQQPGLARGEQIIAAPTLIKQHPAPLRRVVGDLSNSRQVLIDLDLDPPARSTGDKDEIAGRNRNRDDPDADHAARSVPGHYDDDQQRANNPE
jgi:circadian clock protein KaiB